MTDSADMSSFWSAWITVIVLGSIFGCVWLLWVTRKSQKFDSETKQTMGHEFDGIEEYDNPLPQWWMYMFIGTIVFSLVYLALYPGLGNYAGVLGWTSKGQWEEEVATKEALYGPLYQELAAISIEDLQSNEKALQMGQRLFANNCAVCHGSAARGSLGFPNLTDGDWLYGGTPDTIVQTLTHGRQAAMPPWGDALGADGVTAVAHYVRHMAGQETVEADLLETGKAQYMTFCAACHQADGTGMQALGAPNLTDGIWLYGGTQSMVEQTIRGGRNGIMPAFDELLGKERIHLVAAYVYSLSQEK